MKDDHYYMSIANSEAQKALDRGDYPCGCVLILNDKIISKASSEGVTKKDVTLHAEIIAIRESQKKLGTSSLDKCILYTSIEPCLMCAKAIVYAKIKKVVYGTEHKEYGDKKTFDILKQNGIGKDIKVTSGIDKEKASSLLKLFLHR